MDIESFIQDAARGAGNIILNKYHDVRSWRSKTDPGDIVTEVDEASEKYLVELILQEFPRDKVLSEEVGAVGSGDSGYTWIIDPLDGTRNYVMNIPFFCVSIGRVINGVCELGAIFDPVHDEMFLGVAGEGASLNGNSIRVASEETIDDGLFYLSWVKGKTDRKHFVDYVDQLSHNTSYFRRFGSAALAMAYVACGRLHGFVQGGLCPWDAAAGQVIVQEAGGVVTDFQGKSIKLEKAQLEILAANPAIHAALLDHVINRRGKQHQ